jgi:hypothetical protein
VTALKASARAFVDAYAEIRVDAASVKAEGELRYPKRVLRTILDDMNLWSISPVFVFDTARIWPETTAGSGLRYGVGAGVLFSLVSHVNFTVGYARNLNRGTREPAGAVFFSISMSDLFR